MNVPNPYQTIRNELLEDLHHQISTMTEEEKDKFIEDMYLDLYFAKEINKAVKSGRFGPSTEKMVPLKLDYSENEDGGPDINILNKQLAQLDLKADVCFNRAAKYQEEGDRYRKEAEDLKLSSVEGSKKKPSTKCRKQEAVKETTTFSVEGEKRICPVCGCEMKTVGMKRHYRIHRIPARYRLEEVLRETVACPNKCTDENGKAIIRTAEPDEPALIDKSVATSSMVAGIAYDKFVMGTPAYRQEKHLSLTGLPISRQTMGNILEKTYDLYLKPLVKQMIEDLPNCNVVHMDETVLKCTEVKDRKQSSMVVAVSGIYEENQMAVYKFFPYKKQEFVIALLGGSFRHALMTDGLYAYANYYGPCRKLNCMAHARRKIFEAIKVRSDFAQYQADVLKWEKTTLENDEEAAEAAAQLDETERPEPSPGLQILLTALSLFGKLYHIESHVASYSHEARTEVRQELSKPCFERLTRVMMEIQSGFEERSTAYRAAKYFMDRANSLGRYLEDGDYPIDNNVAERAVKPFVINRKNFQTTKSIKGAEVVAAFMTLFRSAEMNDLNPERYMEYVLDELKWFKDDEIAVDVLKSLLPYSKDLPEYLRIGYRGPDPKYEENDEE
ncbi:transposase [Turicimonas muris]|jgi:transposase|uniref:IS66 family transposase n=10 Tax=Bacteria TaxID=2 RepID=UPI002636DE56|nr:transposase [Turicimonas muris]